MPKTSIPRKPATSKAEFQTMEEIRAFTADALSGLGISRTRYEVGGSQIIAGLRKPSTKTSRAHLQNIEAVRQYLDDHLAATKKDPPDNRLLYGVEDTHWLLWSLVDPYGLCGSRELPASVECPPFEKPGRSSRAFV
jgi:hypothetical protein